MLRNSLNPVTCLCLLLLVSQVGCGDKSVSEIKKGETSVKIAEKSNKPTPKLDCNDPILESQIQWAVAHRIYKPEHLLQDRAEIFTVEINNSREKVREQIEVSPGKKIERIKCEADIAIALVDQDMFAKAQSLLDRVKQLGASGLGVSNSNGRMFTMEKYPTEEEFKQGIRKSQQPTPPTVKGNISYVAAIQDDEAEKSKGNYFAFNSEFNVKYLFGKTFGEANFSDALRDADVVLSWLDPDFKVESTNSEPWGMKVKERFADHCKKFQFQLGQCDCMISDFQKVFSEKQFQQVEKSFYFQDGGSTRDNRAFLFRPDRSTFHKVYPEVSQFLNSVIQKCSK